MDWESLKDSLIVSVFFFIILPWFIREIRSRRRKEPMEPHEYPRAFWRTGRAVGRTIYAMRAEVATEMDPLIGVMDTPALAQAAVEAHNRELAERLSE